MALEEERCRGTGNVVAFPPYFSETRFISTSQLCDTISFIIKKEQKKKTTESKRVKEGEKTQKKYPLILLSGGNGSVNLLTKWLAFN